MAGAPDSRDPGAPGGAHADPNGQAVRTHAHGGAHDHGARAANDDGADRVKDPVCGMMVDPRTTQHRAAHDGHPYWFCSAGCRTKFAADPVRYVDPAQAAAPAEPVPAGTVYTCPMHPEVRQVGPGSCPICGMALEPALVGAEEGPSADLVAMTRRFWVGLVLTLPVFVLEMGGHLFGLTERLGQ